MYIRIVQGVAKSQTLLSDFHILHLKLLWNIDCILCCTEKYLKKKKKIKNEEEVVGQRDMQRPCSQQELGEVKRLIESWCGSRSPDCVVGLGAG